MNIATVLLTVIIACLLVRAVTYVRRRGMCAICEVRGCPLVNLKPARRRSLVARLFKPVRQPPCGTPPSHRPATLQPDVTTAADFDLRTLLSTQERSQR